MIKFFRHVRQKMIKENRLSKYLLYAVGEIILVVVGILIALSINTWNKGRQDLQEQYKLLQDLRSDLLIQQELIAEQITFEELFIAQTDSARGFFSGEIDAVDLQSLLWRLATRHTFVANKATASKMISTGQISLLRNPELVNSIVRYYQLSDYNTTVTNNNNLFIVDLQFGAFVSSNSMGFGSTESGEVESQLTMDPQKRYLLKINLSQRKGLALGAISRFNILQEATTALLDMVENELKSK